MDTQDQNEKKKKERNGLRSDQQMEKIALARAENDNSHKDVLNGDKNAFMRRYGTRISVQRDFETIRNLTLLTIPKKDTSPFGKNDQRMSHRKTRRSGENNTNRCGQLSASFLEFRRHIYRFAYNKHFDVVVQVLIMLNTVSMCTGSLFQHVASITI